MERLKASSQILIILGAAAFVAAAFYVFNLGAFSYFPSLPIDLLLPEGILAILSGFSFLLGRGGISGWSARTAIIVAFAKALHKKDEKKAEDEKEEENEMDEMSPIKMMKREGWKPEGFVRFSLVFIIAGVLMLLIYALSQYI